MGTVDRSDAEKLAFILDLLNVSDDADPRDYIRLFTEDCVCLLRYIRKLEASYDAAPACPRCHEPMVKEFIECHDHSGWMCGFACTCYNDDLPQLEQAVSG